MEEETKKGLNKKIIIIAIVVVLLLTAGCLFFILGGGSKSNSGGENNTDEDIKGNVSPLLYEVTKSGSDTKIYLFGSIHVANMDEIVFPGYVLDAYKNSKYLACEYDMVEAEKNADQQAQLERLTYTDGSRLMDHLSDDTYDNLIKFLKEKEMYKAEYESYKPVFFTSLLAIRGSLDAELSPYTGIDKYFVNKAKADKKEILEVESEEFQMDLLYGFPDRLYDIELRAIVNNYNLFVTGIKQLYEAWKKGDVDEITSLAIADYEINPEAEEYNEGEKALLTDYNYKVLDSRNLGMTDKLEEYYNSNYNTFYMVGTAHLVGENGIVSLLTQRGYTVKQINK